MHRAKKISVVLLAFVWLCLTAGTSSAHFERIFTSSRPAALGGAFVSIADDPSAVVINPAGLTQLTRFALIASVLRPYGVSDLEESFFAVSLPLPVGTAGVSWHRLAVDDVMSEDLITLSFARDLIRTSQDASLSVGASMDLARVAFSRPYDAGKSAVTAGLSVLLRPFPIIGVGYAVRNVNESHFDLLPGGGRTDLDRQHTWGVAYHWQSRIAFNVQRRTKPGKGWTNSAGLEVTVGRELRLRTGVLGRYATGGVGVFWRGVSVDIGLSTHEFLGSTYVVTIGYSPPVFNPYAQQ